MMADMDSPIVIRFRWTADELSQAQRYHFRQACRPVLRFALHFIFALMILAGYGWISSGKSWPIGIGFIVAGIYWFAIRPFDRRWTARRQFANRPDKDLEVEWQVSPDKISTRSSLSQSEISWQLFAKMVCTPRGILLYPNERIFHWLPRGGFTSDSDFQKVVELGKSKIRRHYDVA